MSSSVHTSYGALQIGVFLGVYLFGIVTLQSNIYLTRFPDDRKIFKCLVAAIWCLEFCHTIAITYEVYTAMITYYGRPQNYSDFTGYGIATLMGGLITMVVQTFFSWRLWTVLYHPWKYIGIFAGLMAVMRCGVSIYAAVEAVRTDSISGYVLKHKPMLATLLSAGAGIDLIIAASMLWFLIHRKKKSLAKVSRLLDRLVAYTIRTGLVTSLAAVTILVLFFASPDTLLWLACYTFLAKLYSNSFLSALNSRSGLREVAGGADVSGSNKSHGRGLINRLNPHGAISIQMKTTTEMAVDGNPEVYTVPFNQETSEAGSREKVRDPLDLDRESPDDSDDHRDRYPAHAV